MLAWMALAAAAVEPAPLEFREAPPETWISCPSATTVEIAMVGDIMMHGMQLRAAHRPDGTYSLDGVFDAVAPWLRGADLAIANLETVTAGEDLDGYAGYPRFNSPAALLDALQDAGIDILQTTNNHCLDRGELGLLRTLDAIDARGLLRAGTWRSLEERARPWVTVTLDGDLDVAFLASTFSTNGIPLPQGRPWMVSHLDDGLLESEVARARQEADLVVVGVHWGREYEHRPTADMVALAHRLVAAGADIVMGTHPHVLQPAEVVRATDRLGRPREALVLYSLGNFVSNQRLAFRHGAAIARVEVQHCEALGRTWLTDARFTPFWVDDRLADRTLAFRVLPTPPFGVDHCDDLDLDAADCQTMLRFRDHAAEIFTAEHLDWSLPDRVRLPLAFDWSGASARWWPVSPGTGEGAVSHTGQAASRE